MRKTHHIAFLSLLVFLGALMGCSGNKPAPVSERIAKIWTASKVDENKITVYTKGGASNVRNYTSFKLDLSQAPTVKYTEFDGNTFVGKYSLPTDNRLVLTDLNPVPTGLTTGTIEFTINSIDDNNLSLSRTTTSQKTGGTLNDYTLTNP
ncbi:hypothetical protein [Spirosoma radiotolerans]|uniref:Lipocalin-like domain-containing protein n=1 Tax=Spirosoma radiotolerans TaxID=1379870 RepID=A0A0E4A009_9BACT|nr:hypothetical protein [Spirosoma radiotolerans]AKD57863.1 hypothetical protein SD10_26130 [Spirosoma radiotolerans]